MTNTTKTKDQLRAEARKKRERYRRDPEYRKRRIADACKRQQTLKADPVEYAIVKSRKRLYSLRLKIELKLEKIRLIERQIENEVAKKERLIKLREEKQNGIATRTVLL